jgi:hypothetical protein
MSLVLFAKSQVLQKHLDVKVSMFLGLQLREVKIHCIVAFNGKTVSSYMDQVNVESFDHKGHTSIES